MTAQLAGSTKAEKLADAWAGSFTTEAQYRAAKDMREEMIRLSPMEQELQNMRDERNTLPIAYEEEIATLNEELKRLRAECEALRKDAEWLTIETAPKDGTAVLVAEGWFCYCVEWNKEFDWWAVDDNKLGPFRLRGQAPTHWKPLPTPPALGEKHE